CCQPSAASTPRLNSTDIPSSRRRIEGFIAGSRADSRVQAGGTAHPGGHCRGWPGQAAQLLEGRSPGNAGCYRPIAPVSRQPLHPGPARYDASGGWPVVAAGVAVTGRAARRCRAAAEGSGVVAGPFSVPVTAGNAFGTAGNPAGGG